MMYIHTNTGECNFFSHKANGYNTQNRIVEIREDLMQYMDLLMLITLYNMHTTVRAGTSAAYVGHHPIFITIGNIPCLC